MKKKRIDPDEVMSDPTLGVDIRTAYRFSVLCTLNMRCLAGMYSRKFKLSMSCWRVFSIIGRYERVYPGVVAELTTIEADKVTRAVDRLVEMGLALRTTDPDDRRRVILGLSARGKTVYLEVEAAARAMEAELCSVLTRQEWDQLTATLDKLEAQGREIFTGKDAWEAFCDDGPYVSRQRRFAGRGKAARRGPGAG